MKHLLIVNPRAGGKDRTEELSALARETFAGSGADWEVYTTKGPMDAPARIAAEAENCPDLRVYACGGDGTLNECVCGAVGRENVAVTVLPCGTGNDFVKLFGPEKERFQSLGELAEGEIRVLDAIDCNGRASINICSVGIDARIGCDVHTYSNLPLLGGKLAYLTSTAVNVARGIARPLTVRCGGPAGIQEFSGSFSLVCCCNGGFYGGGFHPVPEARPDDGILDILVVKAVSRLQFFRLVAAYARGGYAKMPDYITHVSGEYLEIDSPAELAVNVDGELLRSSRVIMRLRKGAVRFLVPAGLRYFQAAKGD